MKENYPENIVENCGELIFALDGEGIIRFLNRKIEEFGYLRDEIIGRKFSSLIVGEGGGDDPFSGSRKVLESISRFQLREKSGKVREMEIELFPLKDQRGRVTGQAGIGRNIDAPSRIVSREERLSPGFAHDVKSPLAAMKLSLSILEQSAGEDDLPILKIMNEKLARIQEVMLKLLDLIPAEDKIEICHKGTKTLRKP